MKRGIVWFGLLAACGGGSQGEPPAWVGTEDAVRTADMPHEDVGGLPRETLLDEARMAYLEGSTACFDVTVRSPADEDRGLAQLGGTCTAGDASSPTEVSADEMVSVYDYDENGDVGSVVSEDVTAASWASAEESAPASGLARVVERRSRLCCQVGLADTIVLSLGGVDFSWDMR